MGAIPQRSSTASRSSLPGPTAVLWIGLGIAALLAIAFAGTQYYQHRVAPHRLEAAMQQATWPSDPSAAAAARRHIHDPRGIVRLFDLDGEANLPTAWSAFQLIAVGGLLGVVGIHARQTRQPMAGMWLLLAGGFVLLAIDESAQLHAGMYVAASGEAQRRARGVFYYSWVIPALAVVAVAGGLFARFLLKLPARTRWMFVACGAMYVASAIGGEMIAGWLKSAGFQRERLVATIVVMLEEIGEMTAITLFAAAVLDYTRRLGIALHITARDQSPVDESVRTIPMPRPGRKAA